MSDGQERSGNGADSARVTYEGVLQGINIYWKAGARHEIRVIEEDGPTIYRTFETPEAAARFVFDRAKQNRQRENYYITANCLKKDAVIQKAACDHHVEHRHRLVLDIDPARELRKVNDQKVTATDQELYAVRNCAFQVHSRLREDFGWPEPILIMSGSGYHLVFHIDLPADNDSKRLTSAVLKAANSLWGIPGVADVDETVFNAARVIKIPNTIGRKGVPSSERPHRLAQIVSCPAEAPFVSVEQLQRVTAAYAPNGKHSTTGTREESEPAPRYPGRRWTRDEIVRFLDSTGIRYRDPVPFEGGEKFVLEDCPNGPHGKTTACVFWFPDGSVGFDCKHSPSCDHLHWNDFYALFASDSYARTESSTSQPQEGESLGATESDTATGSEQKVPRNQQYNHLKKLAGKLRRAGLGVDELEAGLWAVNCSQCERPYERSKIREIAELAGTWKRGMGSFVQVDDRPVIMTSSRQLHELAEEAFSALQKANDPPIIFAQGQEVVQIVQTKEGRTVICPVDEAAMRGLLSRTATYIRRTEIGGEVGTFPPVEVVREIRSIGHQVKLDLPLLSGIVEGPTAVADGRILMTHGYDEKTGLFCIPGDIDLSDIPERCDGQDARDAREHLENELLSDFPFEEDDNVSVAHTLAALLTAILRHAIPGLTPMTVFDGTAAGSGKGLLVNLIALIATGTRAHLLGLQGDDEETRKLITSELASNPAQTMVFDNVKGTVRSAALERALTSDIWRDRILRESRSISVPQRATWMMTANNANLSGPPAPSRD